MLYDLLQLCNHRYNSVQCVFCSYEHCPHDCGKCLYYIHFPTGAPAPRKYDCDRMMDYYVCKYACKYTSEMFYGLSRCKELMNKPRLRVLSLGCGPCTDLLALDQLRQANVYTCGEVEYVGIEIDKSIWSNIYTDFDRLSDRDYSIQIIEDDVCKYIGYLQDVGWRPDVIVMQYLLSDMVKHSGISNVNGFISALAKYIDSCKDGTYVICNDISLSTAYGGGRECFDTLLDSLVCRHQYSKCHFNNDNKPNHFDFGEEYLSNALVFEVPDFLLQYEPYTSCSSAQLIIKKVPN